MGIGGIKNNMQGGGAGGAGSAGHRQAFVQLKNLPEEEQRAYELLEALKEHNELQLRAKVLASVGASEPPGAGALKNIALLFARLMMPLNAAGIARFRADRGLTVGGATLSGPIAKAYARALDGNEILVRVDRSEELSFRPSEKAFLQFMREFTKKGGGADEVKPIKRALGLGNPYFNDDVDALENEFVGASTIKEMSRVMTLRNLPLTREGLRQLATALAKETAASAPGANAASTSSTSLKRPSSSSPESRANMTRPESRVEKKK